VIPGSNLFNRASRLIKPTSVQYFQFTSRALNAARQWVPTYADPVALAASVQAVDRSTYVQFNLDFQKNYIRLYASQDIIDLKRDHSGDRFTWNGVLYQIDDQNSWFAQDGWASCLAIEVGPAP
jgi:hypothetical protein